MILWFYYDGKIKCADFMFVICCVYLGTATQLIKAGYGVYGIDYIGHGKSDGLHGYVPSFDELVQDCCDHFTNVCGKY